MNTEPTLDSGTEQPPKQWQILSSLQQRVLGVLIEKAKMTPDSYPMTLNALTNGCNQKSNRSPLLSLTVDDAQQGLDELRELRAVAEVQASGRVPKYRHYAYEWLGVDKVEIAVVTDLLLRGPQTAGALRGHAARMEPIADLDALRPVLDSLLQKELVVALTPDGRGRIFAHNLYSQKAMERLKSEAASAPPAASNTTARRTSAGVSAEEFADLKSEVAELREEIQRLNAQVQSLIGS